jgi:diacylglycerol kinase (ATP)
MRIAPEARVDDGRVDVCIVGPVARVDFLRTFPSVFSGTHVSHPQVTTLQGTTVTVESLDPAHATDLWASGEHVGLLPARIEAVPGALTVVAPTAPRPTP